jgi:hypothetical protein
MESYLDWVNRQSPERQAVSLENLEVCRQLGIAERNGDWALAKELSNKVKLYYKIWKDNGYKI